MEAEQVASPLVLWGPIYTMNPSAPWAEAVVVLEGRIAFVGSKEGSREYLTADAKVIDVSSLPEGGLILPGFQDAHVHPLSGMIIEQSCDMARCGGLEPALALIEEYAADHPEMEWIVGGGWDMSWFPDGLSLASVLDRVMADRPAVFRRVDGHAVWANTAAMKAIDVYHKDFPDPPHGRIDKDPHTGLPIGSFQEQAGDLFQKHIPPLPMAARVEALELGMKRMASLGITAFQDALIRGPNIHAYEEAIRDPKRFPLKCSVCLWWDFHHAEDDGANVQKQVEDQMLQMKAHRSDYAKLIEKTDNKLVRVNTIKLMLDGVMETKTAYLHEPYCSCHVKSGEAHKSHEADHRGITNFPRDYVHMVTAAADNAGFQIHCHSIGDNALSDVLDAFEQIKKEREARGEWEGCDLRHQVAHLQVVRPVDVPRFKALDVIANFQPYWSFKDTWMIVAMQHLQERSAWQYPIREVLDTGAHVCFGSDWFVSSLNPLDGIEVAITHLPLGTKPDSEEAKDPLNPHQRITLEQALRAYTLGSAYAGFLDKETGSIEVGKAADIIVLDKNLFEIPTHDIHTAKVTHTFVDGALVYAASSS